MELPPGPGLIPFSRIAVGARGDGAQGLTSSCWGERPRPTGSLLDRRAVAHSGWGSQACSLSLDAGAAAAARGDVDRRMELPPGPGLISFSRIAVGAGGDGAQGWTSSCWGERPRPTGSLLDRRAVAHSGWGSTGAVTIAADLTSGSSSVRPDPGSGIRENGIGDSGRRRRGGRCGSVCVARAWRHKAGNAATFAKSKFLL